jgi:hypothetical protein
LPQEATIELLKQIVANTASRDSLWIAAIAGGAAVLGAAVSAILAYSAASRAAATQLAIAKSHAELEQKKLRASIVTTERLRWLQDLRCKVAEFYSYIDMQTMHIARIIDPMVEPVSRDELDAISKDAGLRANMLLLMLNRKKPEQDELFISINSALHFINNALKDIGRNSIPPNRAQIAEIKKASYDAMHMIGATAWNKVQGLE